MKSSRLLKYFEEYVKNIDMSSSWAKAKYFHSLKSMDLARLIASSFNIFSEEELVVIELIALFHDIGSFKENSYNIINGKEEDYTRKSISILFDEGIMRKITNDTKYDNIIKLAIFCHNKEGLPDNLDKRVALVCNIIKDVHSIEEIRKVINYTYVDNRIDNFPSMVVYNDFKLFRKINDDVSENNADSILVYLSNLFNLNYNYSYDVVLEKGYISKIVDSLIFTDNKIRNFFIQIQNVLNSYVKKKIGVNS